MLTLLGYSLAWIRLLPKANGGRDVAPALGILAIVLSLMFWPAFIYGWRKFRTHRRLLLLSASLLFYRCKLFVDGSDLDIAYQCLVEG